MPLPPFDAASLPLDAASAALEPSSPRPRSSPAPTPRRLEPPPLPSDTLQHTAFDAIQRRMGGNFAEWEGWDWISDFGDPVAEHHAVREAVGIWDESPLQKWLFRGPDALQAADYCFTNDMASLEVGQARYGAVLRRARQDARRRRRLHAARTTTGCWSSRRCRPTPTTSGASSQGRDVEIEDRTERMPHLQVQGPRSRELLAVADRRRRARACATSASSRGR